MYDNKNDIALQLLYHQNNKIMRNKLCYFPADQIITSTFITFLITTFKNQLLISLCTAT